MSERVSERVRERVRERECESESERERVGIVVLVTPTKYCQSSTHNSIDL